jgi:hypothetical protein
MAERLAVVSETTRDSDENAPGLGVLGVGVKFWRQTTGDGRCFGMRAWRRKRPANCKIASNAQQENHPALRVNTRLLESGGSCTTLFELFR